MLDDEKRRLIEAEEHYRHQISNKLRSEISSIEQAAVNLEKSLWQKISELLNSNFGIWFLSSVLVSGGAALYQITQHHYQEKSNIKKELVACTFEIANRLNVMKFLIQKAKTYGDAQHALTPVNKSFGSVSSEYEHVNIAILYFRGYQLTGIMNTKTAQNVKALEEENLAIQMADPKLPFGGEEKMKLLQIIDNLQQHQSELVQKYE